jgi:GNAT superfamily N-acetyltransferase
VESISIEPLTRSDVHEASTVLAHAFYDSPLFTFLFPRRAARLRINAGNFAATLIDALPFKAVHVARDSRGIVGAACWLPPTGYPVTPWRQVVLVARMAALVPRAPTRLFPSMKYLAATDKAHPKLTHWYLSLLGVDPGRQGGGIGARLVDHTLEELDREGLPAYLETDKESNLGWYARRGFEPRETLRPVPEGPPVWTMWRDPK